MLTSQQTCAYPAARAACITSQYSSPPLAGLRRDRDAIDVDETVEVRGKPAIVRRIIGRAPGQRDQKGVAFLGHARAEGQGHEFRERRFAEFSDFLSCALLSASSASRSPGPGSISVGMRIRLRVRSRCC
jgi:hypothetical protein